MKTIAKLKKITGFATLTFGLLMFGTSANAVVISYQWDLFGSGGACDTGSGPFCNTTLGNTATYTSFGYDLGFQAFSSDLDAGSALLVENNRDTNELGLGVAGAGTGTSDNGELNFGQRIEIDLGAAWQTLDFWQVIFSSVDTNEIALLVTTNSALLNEIAPGSNDWLSFIPDRQLVSFLVFSTSCTGAGNCSDDVLLQSIRARTPEPGTLIMMAIGLGLLGFSRRKSA